MVKERGQLPVERGVQIMLDVCEALREAHEQGVIHRDLKPGNVIVRGDDHVVVVDFGMAKIVTGGGGTGTTALTAHNMVFGTPEYMAPEQARGDELDARCDVYAAGVILYELLTGAVPFTGPTPLSVLTAHMTTEPKPPRDRAPDRGISPAMQAVVIHAITKDPALRYPTATALASAIRQALASPEDIEAVRPAVRVHVDASDGHSATMPAPLPAERSPSTKPEAAPTPKPSVTPESLSMRPSDRGSRAWAVVWVLAALVGVAVGVWLSLRSR
jgi:serine/threonine-protein kinase